MPPNNEIISTRIVNYPCELVWRAYTDPNHLAKWWGPNGFTNTFHEFDLKPGGNWRFIMHGPNGANYPNHSVFVEIAHPERLVFDHMVPPHFQANVTFQDLGEKTKITARMIFKTVEECEKIRDFATPKNEENFDRLEKELMNMSLMAHD